MAFTYTYTTNTPDGSEVPVTLDEEILTGTKKPLQERLAVDHVFAIASNAVDAANTGMHSQITFGAPRSTPGAITADQGMLYTKDVTVNSATHAMLHWIDEDECEKMIMTQRSISAVDTACLNITIADLDPGESTIVDGDTIEVNGTNGLQLKDGGAGVGIQYAKLATGDGEFVDGVTLVIGASGLEIQADDEAGTDADEIASPVIAYGSYTGNGADNRQIDTGITIKHLVVKNTSAGDSGVEMLITDAGSFSWTQQDGNSTTNLIINVGDATIFEVDDDGTTNTLNEVYYWHATGERA